MGGACGLRFEIISPEDGPDKPVSSMCGSNAFVSSIAKSTFTHCTTDVLFECFRVFHSDGNTHTIFRAKGILRSAFVDFQGFTNGVGISFLRGAISEIGK